MITKSYVIYGAGGHAKVIVDLITAVNGKVECIFDDQPENVNFEFMGIKVLKYDAALYPDAEMIVGIGNNDIRRILAEKLQHSFATLIHPTAYVAASARLEPGTVVLANATVQAEVKLGQHVIINAGACIDHEVEVGDFAHIASLVYIGGAANIGEGANIRPGALIKRSVQIPAGTFIKPNTINQ